MNRRHTHGGSGATVKRAYDSAHSPPALSERAMRLCRIALAVAIEAWWAAYVVLFALILATIFG